MMFLMAIEQCKNYKFVDARIPKILDMLLAVFALKMISEDNQALYETGFFKKGTGKLFEDAFKN